MYSVTVDFFYQSENEREPPLTLKELETTMREFFERDSQCAVSNYLLEEAGLSAFGWKAVYYKTPVDVHAPNSFFSAPEKIEALCRKFDTRFKKCRAFPSYSEGSTVFVIS